MVSFLPHVPLTINPYSCNLRIGPLNIHWDQRKRGKSPRYFNFGWPFGEGEVWLKAPLVRRVAQVLEEASTLRIARQASRKGVQRIETRMPNTIPTNVAREKACRYTLKRAAGKNPCGSARWMRKYRCVPSPGGITQSNAYSQHIYMILCMRIVGERKGI